MSESATPAPLIKIGHYTLGRTLGSKLFMFFQAITQFLIKFRQFSDGTFGKVKIGEHGKKFS